MPRAWLALVLGFALTACGSSRSGGDGGSGDGGSGDGGSADGAGAGEICMAGPMSDAQAQPCRSGLLCCYPCGIPDCDYRCTEPVRDGGCPGPFP